MSTQGTVYDLGYSPHEGERLGRAGAVKAMLTDGVRRSLGLRRKAWTKVLPWGLIAAAIVPAAFVVAVTFLTTGVDVEDVSEFMNPAEFFENIGSLAMLFVALITPTLLIPDRKHGVLAIYASRPVHAGDYLLARVTTVAVLTSLFILIPHAVLYVGVSALNTDGVWAGLALNAQDIPAIVGTTLAIVVGFGAPAVLVSLYVDRVAIASGVYVVAMFMTAGLSEAIPRASDLSIFKALAPLALFFNPYSVRDWLFEIDPSGMPLARVDLPNWVAVAAIAAFAAVTALLAMRKYRREI